MSNSPSLFNTRRAKIVCTLGPSTSTPEAIRALVEAGMDVARLNFSHGTHADHAAVYKAVRQASDDTGRGVGILADLQGPKIRLGNFSQKGIILKKNQEFTITIDPCEGDDKRAWTTYSNLPSDVRPGDTLLIDDGLVRLEVVSSNLSDVKCKVIEPGPISDHKGINLPGVSVSAPVLTQKDMEDLRFALSLRVDIIALSFVRRAEDVFAVREIMAEVGADLPVIAKIERPEAVTKLEDIVDAFDGLMVARGDLGVELPLEEVPLVQKSAIQLARAKAKPVIVATQMLESMIQHARPTRAEASDVANAVLDGADAVMLSGETSVGSFPTEAVSTMARIITAAEEHSMEYQRIVDLHTSTARTSIAKAGAVVGEDIGAKALVAFTQSGATAKALASHRSKIPLMAFTPEPAVRSQLCLVWGVETFVVPTTYHTDEMIAQVNRAMLELKRGSVDDVVTIVAGTPPGKSGATNMLRVHRLA